jgi:hypothetical protein
MDDNKVLPKLKIYFSSMDYEKNGVSGELADLQQLAEMKHFYPFTFSESNSVFEKSIGKSSKNSN